jgi:hypothetical protein
LQYWVNKFLSNTQYAQIDLASDIIATTEYRTDAVTALYQTVLQRAPDAAGLTAWLGYLASGHSLDQVQAHMESSSEYESNHGGTTAGMVEGWYADILGRSADAAGLIYWTTQIQAGDSPMAVALTMRTKTKEGIDYLVTQSYQLYFGHGPSEVDFGNWETQLQDGIDTTAFLVQIIGRKGEDLN